MAKPTFNHRKSFKTTQRLGRLCVLLACLATVGLVGAQGPPPPARLPLPTEPEFFAPLDELPAPKPVLRRMPEPLPSPEETVPIVDPVLLEPIPAGPLAAEPLVLDPTMAPSDPLANLGEITFCNVCGTDSCGSGGCCADCQSASRWGRFTRSLYRGICCPDPCYQPVWRPRADAAFFTSAARPQSQQRFRWDHADNLTRPDRAEYFWARGDGNGLGPSATGPVAYNALDYDELRHYTEVAHGAFGASFEYSYRAIDTEGAHFAGFGDMTIGTKSLMFDTELIQVAFKFDTHVPQGASREGLGTGHVSLEPGLIFGLNLSDASYLQAEVSEWIPLGGDDQYAGAIFKYNASYNHVLAYLHPCVPLIGTAEISGWRFQDGAFTAPGTATTLSANGDTYLHASGGVRIFFCDKADFGVAYSSGVTSNHWAESLIRTELRFRF